MRGRASFATQTRRILVSLFAFENVNSISSNNNNHPSISVVSTSALSKLDEGIVCRSNATHIVWRGGQHFLDNDSITMQLSSSSSSIRKERGLTDKKDESIETRGSSSSSSSCFVQSRAQAEQECLRFLKENLMAFDQPFHGTMGFPEHDDDDDENTTLDTDGLDYGMIQPTIRLALDAKVQYPWTDALPRDIFMDYVLNYANLNEARTNWRPLLVEALKFNESDLYLSGQANISSVTTWVNQHLWTKLARQPDKPIFFKSSQTPLIFDPMSTIAFGYASCTGTSILFCNALRSLGIPARVAGTPAWYGDVIQGNHNWVEVYVGRDVTNGGDKSTDDGWKFLEPSPALPHVDTLDANPCDRWFCDPSRYPSTKVYAAKMSKRDGIVHFPLAWEWNCKDVPAIDRTDYYTRICGSCHNKE
ncbi:transglutaminase [Nitzschia inconspicua]|uniref:Transglutaminase n=1 Tax=Nitzschia inconspicua TaxID=303405 RepID=A0A9K3KJ83_9STRA|nr:transglutaminase [Nitzschia inconspicua]